MRQWSQTPAKSGWQPCWMETVWPRPTRTLFLPWSPPRFQWFQTQFQWFRWFRARFQWLPLRRFQSQFQWFQSRFPFWGTMIMCCCRR